MNTAVKIGLFGVGLDTYWGQFEGLRDRLDRYRRQIAARMAVNEADVVDAGLVDTPEKAAAAGAFLAAHDVELIFVYISTYALSSTTLPAVRRTSARVILLNLQPTPAIDYTLLNSLGDRAKMTGEWLAHCQACSAPEMASVLRRSNIPFSMVTGYLEDEQAWREIDGWIGAARTAHRMRTNRMGILGHYYCGMLDVYTDLTAQSAVFGTHIEMIEMCSLKQLRDAVTDEQIDRQIDLFHTMFDISPQCSASELRRAARTSVALDRLIEQKRVGSLAYYYEGSGDYQDIVTSLIAGNTLLTARGIPIAGECEVKNVQAMKILSELGAGGSFSEFYAMDFQDDVVLLGHDGPAHPNIAEGRVQLVPVPVYHGKPGQGLSIQMSVRHGEVTVLSVCEGPEGIFLLVAEGESVPGPVLQIGNTNSRYRFTIGARGFMDAWSNAGPSHHCAIGVGHIADRLEKLATILGIGFIRIC